MDFLQGNSIYVYLFIFFGKMLEVTAATIRIVLINRGERIKGSIVAIMEIMLWIIITGTVLAGFTSDIWKVVVFCAAFATGVYLGSWLEGKLAIGLSTMHVITDDNHKIGEITDILRSNHIAVTVMDGEGKSGHRKILLIHIRRSRVLHAIKLINAIDENSVITVSDVRALRGGYIKK